MPVKVTSALRRGKTHDLYSFFILISTKYTLLLYQEKKNCYNKPDLTSFICDSNQQSQGKAAEGQG